MINQQGVYVEVDPCVRGSLLFCERAQEQVTRFYQVIIDAGGSPTAIGCLLMRCSGMGYREIGARCSPPISRQGVEKHLRQARRRLRGLDRRGCLLFQAAGHLQVDK